MSDRKKLCVVMAFICGGFCALGVYAAAGFEILTVLAASLFGGCWMYLAGASE